MKAQQKVVLQPPLDIVKKNRHASTLILTQNYEQRPKDFSRVNLNDISPSRTPNNRLDNITKTALGLDLENRDLFEVRPDIKMLSLKPNYQVGSENTTGGFAHTMEPADN